MNQPEWSWTADCQGATETAQVEADAAPTGSAAAVRWTRLAQDNRDSVIEDLEEAVRS